MRRVFLMVFCITIGAGCLSGRAVAQAVDPAVVYADGVTAFQAGDYAQALDDFLKARDAGYTGPQLGYSLGSTYYQLGRYASAQREFQTLSNDPDLAGLCHYNLGLIALKQGDPATARSEFKAAEAQATDPAIKQLATTELAKLPPPPAQHPWFAYVDTAAGYDDDVAPVAQSGLVLPAQQGSSFVSLLAGGSDQLTGTYADGTQLSGSLYRADFLQLSHFNETFLTLGPEYRRTDGPWGTALEVSASHMILGSDNLESSGLFQFEESRSVGGTDHLKGGYEYEHVVGGSGFDYLSGSRQALFVEDAHTERTYELTLGYLHEINRRNDLAVSQEFFSDSPIRNRVYGRFDLHLTGRFSTQLALRYENSLYGMPDSISTGNTSTTLTRHDRLYDASAGAKYELSRGWNLRLEYRYLRNQSNIESYAYESHRATLSLEILFY